MNILPRSHWGAQPPKSITPIDDPEGFVIHWVGAGGMNAAPSDAETCATLRNIQSAEMSREYVDIAYNFAVDPAGRVYELRGWDVRSGANGTASANAHLWAVVYVGGPGVPLTDEGRWSLAELVQTGSDRWGGVSYVKPHREVASTACPGDELAAYCATLTGLLRGDATPPPAPPVGAVVRPTVRRGSSGGVVRELQERLNRVASAGLSVDGRFGPRAERAVRDFQQWCVGHGIDTGGVDGIVGPKTWRVLDDFFAMK